MPRRQRPLKHAFRPPTTSHTPATIFSLQSEPNNPCVFCICAPHGEETALCPIGLRTDLNVFNKTDTVDIRSTRCHGRCGEESQLWVGELFTSPLYSPLTTTTTEQLKGSSVHLKQKKKNHNNSTQPHQLLSRLKPYSVRDLRARSHGLANAEGSAAPSEGSKACNGERWRSVMQPKYSAAAAAAPAPNVII